MAGSGSGASIREVLPRRTQPAVALPLRLVHGL
jgi:hypothetical protein